MLDWAARTIQNKQDKLIWMWLWELQTSVDLKFRKEQVIWESHHLENLRKIVLKGI